jgi:hypothetical protein
MHMESGPQRHRIVVLLKPRPDFYRSEFASGTDTLLVIEVSDTTLSYDCDVDLARLFRS